ncbi:MAG: M16 family metallopeptidase [Alphaproteobacteria bacterium]
MMALQTTGAHAGGDGVFHPQSFTLDNGLQVVIVEDHRVPAVSHFIWYRVGAMDEPRGKSGIAHFLEHLMFKATKTIPEGEFSRRIGRMGGDLNAFTAWDYTAYYVKIAREHLPVVMAMEADRMRNIDLSEEAVKTERDVVLAERKQVVDSDVTRQFSEQMAAALYQNHPYSVPIIGWMHEIQALNRQDALAFYQTYYAPNNAVVVISGDITLQDAKTLAQQHYGPLKPSVLPPKVSLSEPPHLAHWRLSMNDARVSMPTWERQYIVPSALGAPEEPHLYALQVLSALLASGDTGLLHEYLVHDLKVANAVSVDYDPQRRGPSVFEISVVPSNSSKPAFSKIESAVDALLTTIDTRLAQDDMDRVKTTLVAEATFARDGLFYPGMIVGQTVSIGQSVDYIETWPDRIAAVTKQDILAAVKTLRLDNAVTGTLAP